MSTFLSAPQAYLNFALKLRGFLKNTVTRSDAKQTMLKQLANREENFLKALETNVFNYPRSPYLRLFQAANVTHADVKTMISQQGMEDTLEELYDAGIYITFEEFKGRVPIKRGNLEFMPDSSDFDNPILTPSLLASSGGSTGKPTRTKMDLDYIAQLATHEGVGCSIHNVLGVSSMVWMGILPDYSGIAAILVQAYSGQKVTHWFSTFHGNEANLGWYYTLLTYVMVIMARFHGFKFPFPQYVSLDNPLPIAKILAKTVQETGTVLLDATMSKCVRISVAAKQHNIDLTGVTFFAASEPTTSAKVAIIEASGANFMTHYGSTETGTIGLACSNPADITDVHFLSNSLAFIQRPRQVFDQTVDAFHFTSFLPSAPKMLLNVQLGCSRLKTHQDMVDCSWYI
jgi:hypothetical protein